MIHQVFDEEVGFHAIELVVGTWKSVIFVRINEHLELFVVFNKLINELEGVFRVDVIVGKAVNYKQMVSKIFGVSDR